ncbi:DUF3139 domain-containing protein [Enterococcus dongliensis]|nr:DUF3139 domain-containing protein [Enterococcus dongliensis]MDT2646146.1 DUF3139 domain-containing protein [Enterococcus dongliensis]MDT2675304.1 DUF3139 domain-containing protein [Enterococcus dongliensis]MDT2704233.1 DUF3139 domain-containing protein [Enterococcus dongliensis]
MWISYAKKNWVRNSFIIRILFNSLASHLLQHRTYFTGAVRTYMVAQKIPTNSIKSQKIVFNWVNMGQWEEDVSIHHQHHTYQYIYNMSWQDKKVSLSIYNHREGVKDTLAPYPPLEYDR